MEDQYWDLNVFLIFKHKIKKFNFYDRYIDKNFQEILKKNFKFNYIKV